MNPSRIVLWGIMLALRRQPRAVGQRHGREALSDDYPLHQVVLTRA
jgi:hypothetical protein